MRRSTWLGLGLLLLCICSPGWTEEREPNEALWLSLEEEIRASIDSGQIPGAVILVGRGGQVLFHKAVGMADVSSGDLLTTEHLFDAASLTKPLVTAVSVLLLAQEGKIGLQAPVSEYLPVEFEDPPTIEHLLTHHSGLPAVIEAEGLPESLLKVKQQSRPGERFLYSDVGFMLLQQVVEKQSGQSLDDFYKDRIARPLELRDALFLPRERKCVPTYGVAPGRVHDPRARYLGGVAGHAGLFATALDVHKELVGLNRVLEPEYRELLFRPARGGRTLGLDQETRFSTARGERFSPLTSAGHTGFTGTSFWWDEPTGIHVVLMSSRLHPDNEGDVRGLRSRVATLVGEHFLGRQVKTGLDVLAESNFDTLRGKKVGFVLNQTSRDRFGRHLSELIAGRSDFTTTALFTPEHGLLGVRDEKIEHGFHQGLQVPIYSLYGETRKPKREWLEELDLLVFDLQDVGVRYYTYISTLKGILEVARETGTEVMVLDRPNPLGGQVFDGNLARSFSFIACDALPTVHGLTVGEAGRFLNREIRAELAVQRMRGWARDMTWEQTGLSLFSPSPNLAELEAIQLYPVLGQMEWCEVSVGRGTNSPFRVIGAPYVKDPTSLAAAINELFGERIVARPRYFAPRESKFANQVCGGVELLPNGRLREPAQLGLMLAELFENRYPGQFHRDKMIRHLGLEGLDQLNLVEVEEWENVRRPYLLYR